MNNIHQFPDVDRINDEASNWLAKLDRGLSDEEDSQLKEWLVSNEENRRVLFNMANLWDKMDSLSKLQDLFPHVSQPKSADRRLSLALAASIFAIGFSVIWLYLVGAGEQVSTPVLVDTSQPSPLVADYNDIYETAIGEHSSVNLPDGTEVILNTDSHIQVTYTDRERYIVLSRGEAHFDVAKDEKRPLTVQAGDKYIQAVGTAFNVEMRLNEAVELIVTEGKVVVIDNIQPGKGIRHSIPIRITQDLPVVSEGESATLDSAGPQIRKMDADEIAADLSWREGNLIFEGETLEEAIFEISRYTSVKFEILDERLKTIRVAGLFKAGDINGLLETLQDNFQITSQRVGAERVLLGAK
jgi:transmembrane sensor